MALTTGAIMPRPETRQFIIEVIRQVEWAGPVIDLGAGKYSDCYRDLFGTAQYKTLDFEQNKLNHIDIIADILSMPQVASNSYGVVLLLDTLEHVKNPFTAFEESARILKPDGLFICSTVASWVEHKHPRDYWRFLHDGLALLCTGTNLKIFRKETTAPATCIPCQVIIAAKKTDKKNEDNDAKI